MEIAYFFDTYALIEIARGRNESYRKYLNADGITTKLNLMELYFAFLREGQQETGRILFKKLSKSCVNADDDVLAKAAEMRLKFIKLDLSYVDCIGYLISQKLGIPFLTGDSKFRDFPGVEFVR